ITLPQTDQALQDQLSTRYNAADWQPAIDAIMATETDELLALETFERLKQEALSRSGLKLRIP
ncbi:hypothetical protein M378DRAFT_40014, partial [Amanita muscaria Koide BX008]